MGDALQGRWTVVEGQRIFARVSTPPVAPDLTPVVLVHGLGVSSRYMIPTATRLSRYRRVYAPDLPGFGESSHPPQALNVAELAAVLTQWMRAMGIHRATLLGNSLGCQIVAHVAAEHPEMVERAILVGPTMDPAAGTWGQVGRLLLDTFCEPPSYLPLLVSDYLRAGVRRTLATFRYGLRDDTLRLYTRMTAPTLIVRGERDPIAPQRWAEELAARIPDARVMVIPGAGHASNYNSPDALTGLVRRFLDGQLDVRSLEGASCEGAS